MNKARISHDQTEEAVRAIEKIAAMTSLTYGMSPEMAEAAGRALEEGRQKVEAIDRARWQQMMQSNPPFR